MRRNNEELCRTWDQLSCELFEKGHDGAALRKGASVSGGLDVHGFVCHALTRLGHHREAPDLLGLQVKCRAAAMAARTDGRGRCR